LKRAGEVEGAVVGPGADVCLRDGPLGGGDAAAGGCRRRRAQPSAIRVRRDGSGGLGGCVFLDRSASRTAPAQSRFARLSGVRFNAGLLSKGTAQAPSSPRRTALASTRGVPPSHGRSVATAVNATRGPRGPARGALACSSPEGRLRAGPGPSLRFPKGKLRATRAWRIEVPLHSGRVRPRVGVRERA